ncbi:hypothetical protein T02_9599 [Trichinella nativa]|uniref:Uncharacterized protein n=4 Tax=Trichinella TaxID=6333 RepID=A0A0V1LPU0_9BILA|nr:hypothetical protein T02_9599 [Trichinella nativa]
MSLNCLRVAEPWREAIQVFANNMKSIFNLDNFLSVLQKLRPQLDWSITIIVSIGVCRKGPNFQIIHFTTRAHYGALCLTDAE